MDNFEIILVALLAVSEALSLIPQVKANSIFQLAWNAFKTLQEKRKELKELVDSFKNKEEDK